MRGFVRENAPSVLISVFLHGLLVAALILATHFSFTRSSRNEQAFPVSATVVNIGVLREAQRIQQDAQAEAAAAIEAATRAKADAAAAAEAHATEAAAEQAKAAAEASSQALAAEDAKQAAAAKQAADAARAAEAVKAADAQRVAEKQAAEAKAAADAALAAKAAADAALAAKTAEAKRLADAKKAADDKARAAREAELQKQLADEEHATQIESGPLGDQYKARLQSRITHAWIKPNSARSGIDCTVEVTQVPGGEVTNARVLQCNGDAAVRQSIENAVYRASPLPDPPDPSLFHRVFVIEFTPND
jgi:colicin import membrane protein